MSLSSPRRPVLTALLVVLLGSPVLPLVGSATPARAAGPAPGARGCAVPLLAEPTRAVDVRRSSRSTFAAAAARNDLAGPGLADLAEDRTLWLDECGAAFYVEPTPDDADQHRAGQQEADQHRAPGAAPLPAGTDVLDLSSDPGATRTIYLDFLGGPLTGTAWNASAGLATIDVAPMSLDEQVGADLSQAEREAVHQAWLVVAEDFAPFDVNVTTRDPGVDAIRRSSSSDQRYGSRVVVTTGGPVGDVCGCGGIAYLGVVGLTGSAHDYYQPAWVFADTMYDGWDIGQAASHEVGHNFGLDHDGTSSRGYYAGHAGWGPIMGVSYQRALSQWSRGEYADANNQEDDLALIARNAPRRPDDHAEGPVGATPLAPGTSATGVVGTAQDVDAFALTAAGDVTVSVGHPEHLDTNLDLRMTVLDAAGAPVATLDPVPVDTRPRAHPVDPGLEAVWRATLPRTPAAYTVLVEGVGAGVPTGTGYSDYGSLGRYEIRVEGGLPPAGPLSVSGPDSFTVGAGREFALTGLVAQGGSAPYAWSGTGLPAGVRVDPATGTLTGSVAQAPAGGVLDGRVVVTDAQGATVSRAVTLLVEQLQVPTQSPGLIEGTPGRVALRATGSGPVSWSLRDDVTGSLPPGLALEADGTLHGTPLAAGTYPVPVRVGNAWTEATGTVTVVVAPAGAVEELVVPDTSLRFVHRRTASHLLGAVGALGPVTWEAASELPPGLSLLADGTLAGRPAEVGATTLLVRATTPWSTVTAPVDVVVDPRPLAVRTRRLDDGRVDRRYAETVRLRHAVGPVRWRVVGSLPAGLALRPAAGSRSARLTGSPDRPGRHRFTIRVADRATGLVARRGFRVVVRR